MKNHHWLFLLFLVACSSKNTELLENHSTCELRIGEDTLCGPEGLQVRLTRGVSDSRCPVNAQCVWEGKVEVALTVEGAAIRLALDPGKPEAASARVKNHTIRLLTVEPYPVLGEDIDPEDYVVGVVVE